MLSGVYKQQMLMLCCKRVCLCARSDSSPVVSESSSTDGLDNGAWSENGVRARGLIPFPLPLTLLAVLARLLTRKTPHYPETTGDESGARYDFALTSYCDESCTCNLVPRVSLVPVSWREDAKEEGPWKQGWCTRTLTIATNIRRASFTFSKCICHIKWQANFSCTRVNENDHQNLSKKGFS